MKNELFNFKSVGGEKLQLVAESGHTIISKSQAGVQTVVYKYR